MFYRNKEAGDLPLQKSVDTSAGQNYCQRVTPFQHESGSNVHPKERNMP